MTDSRPIQQPIDAAGPPRSHPPSDREVEALIAAATKHPLGTAFLIGGHLGTVAITFQVHAFTVDAARHRLREATTGQ